MKRLFASFAVREALLIALVVLAAVAAFGWSAMTVVDRSLRADLLHTIDTDLAGLVDVEAAGGVGELARRIGDRTALATRDSARPYYLLLDGGDHARAGNLPALPDVDVGGSGVAETTVRGDAVLVRATRLRGGATLVVGRSLAHVDVLETALARRLLLAALAVIAVALVVGLAAARRLERRIARVNRVFHRFTAGDLAARVPAQRPDDEITALGRHIDHHLDRIAQLIAAQRDIADNIAHELRTPLAHLDTRLRLLLEQAEGSTFADPLAAARADVRSIVSLFEALLDVALAEGDARHAAPAIDLSALAADLADLYAASAEEAGLAFAVRIAPGVTMRGQPMQVSRLISNLLDNAIKFVPAGCAIGLTVEPGPMIVVEDDGPGILPEDRELVFRRFSRAHSQAAGHGLGLALVRVIAARHGLTVRLEDANPGARFVVAAEERR